MGIGLTFAHKMMDKLPRPNQFTFSTFWREMDLMTSQLHSTGIRMHASVCLYVHVHLDARWPNVLNILINSANGFVRLNL